jgi:hypothetical protein
MKKLIFICFLLSNYSIIAQKITGQVVDTNEAIAGAIVYLHRSQDSTLIKVGYTDKNGNFEFLNLNSDTYQVLINVLGFERELIKNIRNQQDINIGIIELKTSQIQLKEITIRASKPLITVAEDRTVLNIENSILSEGSNALAILDKSPAVSTSTEGGIMIRGKQGVILMIDGRVSPLSGGDLALFLQNIASNTIEKIEVITNPSAKYDAAGNAGVINIILKKDQKLGTNGSMNLGAGYGLYPKANAGISLNRRDKKLNIYGSYNYNFRRSSSDFLMNRTYATNQNNQILNELLNQNSINIFEPKTHTTKLGIDFFLSKNTVLGIMGDITRTRLDINTDSYTGINKIGNQDNYLPTELNAQAESLNQRGNQSFNLNLKHTFTKKQELSFDIDFANFFNDNNQVFTNNFIIDNISRPPFYQFNDQTGSISVRSIKSDFAQELKNKINFEAGFKSSWVESQNDVKFYNQAEGEEKRLDLGRTNNFIYDENINAAYVNFRKSNQKSNWQLGLRVENTNIDGLQVVNNETFSRNYTQLFPNVLYSFQTPKKNKISLSYNRRIDRPVYRYLNPFKIFVDPYTTNAGNPAVNPVSTNALEVNHNYKGKLITAFTYSYAHNVLIELFTREESDPKVQIFKPFNLSKRINYGVSFTAPLQVKKWWNSNNFLNLYRNIYDGLFEGELVELTQFSYRFNSTNSFVLPNNFTAELSGFYQSPLVFGTFSMLQNWQISAGIQKNFPKQNAILRLNISDIFWTQIIQSNTFYTNTQVFFKRTDETRVATIAFSHRFGKKTVSANRNRNTGVEDIKGRI